MTEKGHLQLKIKIGLDGRLERQRTSQPVIIHQLPWIIRVNQVDGGGHHHLCCNVVCNSESQDTHWNCVASVVLQVLAQNKLLAKSECKQIFNSQENSCGYSFDLGLLMAPDYMYDYNGSITVEADIKMEAPYPKAITSLVDRMVYLLSSGKDANVHFLVGTGEGEKEQFAAHKGILATVSDVFDRMFDFDSNQGNSEKMIEVTDVTPEAFRVLLNFIYTTNLGGLSQENVFDILHAAKKYAIIELVDACAVYPKLDVDNVLYALGKALLYDVKNLIDRCWKFVDRNAIAVLKNQKFVEIDQSLLCNLFAKDQLRLRDGELTVWNAALHWADEQCRKHNVEATGDNRRNFLGSALFNIRFPLIPKDQFASIIVPSGLLTEKEILAVCLYHLSHNKSHELYPLIFSTKLRA